MSSAVVPTAAPELDAFKLRSPLGPAPPFGKDTPLCVVQYEDWVYISLDNGTVCAYMIEPRRPNRKEEERKWGEGLRKRVARAGIRHMCVIDPQSSFQQAWTEQLAASGKPPAGGMEQPLLFLLADGRVLALHAYTLELAVDFSTIRDVDLFTIDLLPPHHLILHQKTKRKLNVVSYTFDPLNPTKSKHDIVKDLTLTDTPIAVALQGDNCVVAYRNKYVLLSVSTGAEAKELPVPLEGGRDPQSVAPCIHIMSSNELLLSSNTNLGLFIDFKGRPLPRNPVDWGGHSPFHIAQVDHYVVGLFTEVPYEPPVEEKSSKSGNSGAPTAVVESRPPPPSSAQFTSIRIASLLDNRIVQTIPIPNPSTCNSSRDKCILLTSDGYLFTLYVVSLEEQIAQYMEASRTEEALALLQRTVPDTVRVLEFHVEAGFVMLRDLQLVQAFSHFVSSNVDPRELIVLFPDLIVAERGSWSGKHAVGSMDEVIEKGRRKAEQRSEDKRYRAVLSMTNKQLQRQARLHLAQFLWDRRERGKLWDDDDIPWVDTVLLMLCVEFMDDEATQPPSTAPTTAIVPSKPGASTVSLSTTTFPFTLQQLLLPTNQIIQSEAETYLLVKHRYNALASYYLSINQQRQALEVYHRLGSGEFTETDRVTGVRDSGVAQTVGLLLVMGDDELLWEFAEWVLLMDAEAGLSVFTSTTRKVQLPTEKVLGYLKRVNGKRIAAKGGDGSGDSSGGSDGPDIVESYLEHIVMHGIVKDTLYHTQLALTYLRKIYQLQQQPTTTTNGSANDASSTGEDKDKPAEGKKKKKKKHPVAVNNTSLYRPTPGSEPAPLGPLRRKLYRFLQAQPSYYDARSVLSALLGWVWPMEERERRKADGGEDGTDGDGPVEDVMDGLWLPAPDVIARTELPLVEEMILLLARLELDEKVLRLFIYALRDHTGAAQYCLTVTKTRMRKQQQELYERIVRESKETREKRLLDDEQAMVSKASSVPQRKNSTRRREEAVVEEEVEIDDDEDVMDEDLDEEQLRARQKKRRLRAQREQLRLQREERERQEREEEERRQKAAEEAEHAASLSASQQPLGEDESPHPGDVFLELIGLYFSDAFYHEFATGDEKRQVEEQGDGFIPPTAYQYAVDAITLYHPYINTVKAIAHMPDFVPLAALAPLFTRLLPRTLHNRQHHELLKGLSRSHHLHLESESIAIRSRGVVVDERRRCAHCDKLVGDSILVGLPVKAGDADWDKGVRTVGGEDWVDVGKGSGSSGGLAPALVMVHYQCSLLYSALRAKGKGNSGGK